MTTSALALPASVVNKITVTAEGCWAWTGAISNTGYASLNVNGRTRLAHRLVYELVVGPVPDGLELDHLCRVRHCVRPDHLEAVTHAVNVQRAIDAKGKAIACPNGHPYTEANTYSRGGGRRQCKTCVQARKRRYAARLAPAGAA